MLKQLRTDAQILGAQMKDSVTSGTGLVALAIIGGAMCLAIAVVLCAMITR